ncbi:HepT-like ribonuclease domain-containing protein [Hymenobacter weizhouensis]|uniref:HepT-like ribonuclease domain-containing protein n=1 Tax=Hymenobacter sp. YIM 151500-1 TaxID=2987689 RepID=UPI002225FE73|nr:DUF86 domain-containing protein [Hymenobacter sp. YIM 151500-1]UYZ61625.1 DUF86 domain-containing protein [Hymenobacter sp. YIM 151500-1]
MTKRFADKQRLEHMLTAIDDVLNFTATASETEFIQNRMMQFACVRGLKIIGEAANHLTIAPRDANPHIRWRDVVGMRNFAAHQYFDVQNQVIWDAVRRDLPALKLQLQQVLSALSA